VLPLSQIANDSVHLTCSKKLTGALLRKTFAIAYQNHADQPSWFYETNIFCAPVGVYPYRTGIWYDTMTVVDSPSS